MKFFRFGSTPTTLPATGKGDRIYAIGDVHGRLDLLRDLLQKVERHNATLPRCQNLFVVLLGDLIDRGDHSAQVLSFLHGVQQKTGRLLVLKGNHEDLMLRALDGEPGMMKAWMRFGGDKTLRSFGIEPPKSEEEMFACSRMLASAIPRDIVEWLRALPLSARSGDYFFCHAGIRPGVPLKRQVEADLLWIRKEFLEDATDHGTVIVHGHSISDDVQVRENRIGIDTGAYRTGVLTALFLEGTERDTLVADASTL